MKVKSIFPLEKDVQRDICEFLSLRGEFFWRSNNIPVFGRSGDGVKRFRAMPKYSAKGVPDIIIVLPGGKFLGVEVKRQGVNTIRPEQEIFAKRLKDTGAFYFVAHSLEEFTTLFMAICAYQNDRGKN